MRALVVTTWVFINLLFFGMCGYMYLLWSQYWMYIEKDLLTTTNNYEQQIYYYNRGLPLNQSMKIPDTNEVKNRTKHATKANITIIKNSKPRFPNLQSDFVMDTQKYSCFPDESKIACKEKVMEYKEKILNELKRVFLDESNVLKSGLETHNPYNVLYTGVKENHMNKNQGKLMCEFKSVKLETLKKSDIHFSARHFKDVLPKRNFYENKQFKSCAVVASSGSLRGLGSLIDAHDVVLRFNHAPTIDYEEDVGSKTTIRILNSQVVSKAEYNFLEDPLYRNITLIAWDPSNYKSTLEEWYNHPEYNLFYNYVQFRRNFPKSRFYLLNPKSLWSLWDFLQSNSPSRLRKNPPSSGFLGLALLLPHCDYVDVFEYIPSTRVTKKCHYYDTDENPACTFGVWHPLAAEKLLTYSLNIADDFTVFNTGFIRVTGFQQIKC